MLADREIDMLYNGSFFRKAPRPIAFLELQDDEAALSAIAAQSGATNLGYTAREQALGVAPTPPNRTKKGIMCAY